MSGKRSRTKESYAARGGERKPKINMRRVLQMGKIRVTLVLQVMHMTQATRVKPWVVRISPEMHSAVRVYAFQANISISEAVEKALRYFIGPACKRQGKAIK